MSSKIKQPTLLSKVHPKVLYNTQELNARVVKVQSPFEYMNYIKRRQEYLNKQRELLNNLQLSKENYEKLTFSVKQIGVVNDDGRFGTYSQRRYLLKSMESTRQQKSESIQCPQTERAQYQFRAKALPSSRKEKFRFSPQSTAKFFLLPERQETNFEVKNSPVDKILKRSRQKKRIPQSQPLPPEVIFPKSQLNPKYSSYSRELQELTTTVEFNKLP
ncbi:unnamed protein product (macronuclear) [Paramecium tetraurelia]|uniref:TPX2 C-terminal domain-containing protein n=1 Tax=Paramecium tetraurelia TaxID=5888 RepID=A0EIK2_PARTE|nr:uncharacterized protein GSPATT00027472001 [Paramecium tetraurelia]CAK95143.1 unnamed protein product [Paramecium tetraurelia]|eukprot:XP_001462516.1 hypothetical protein (macronuclear) [Paramecium tetraurelia strain d4-2]